MITMLLLLLLFFLCVNWTSTGKVSYAAGFGSATMCIWWIPRVRKAARGSTRRWTTYLARNGSSIFACLDLLPGDCWHIAPRRCSVCGNSYRTIIRSRWTNLTHWGRSFGPAAMTSTYSYTGYPLWTRTQITNIDSSSLLRNTFLFVSDMNCTVYIVLYCTMSYFLFF